MIPQHNRLKLKKNISLKEVVFVTKKKKKYFINLIFHNPYDNTLTYSLSLSLSLSLSNSNISPSLGEERIKGLCLDVSMR